MGPPEGSVQIYTEGRQKPEQIKGMGKASREQSHLSKAGEQPVLLGVTVVPSKTEILPLG